MSRLKRVIPVLLIGALVIFAFTGCTNPFSLLFGSRISTEDAVEMRGIWNLVAGGENDVMQPASELGFSQTFEFKDDGNAIATVDGDTVKFRWKKNGNTITIWDPNEGSASSAGQNAYLSDDYFTWKWRYNGKAVDLIFARKGTAAEDPSRYVTASNTTQNNVQNTTPNNPQPVTNNNPIVTNPTPPETSSNSDLTGTWYCSSVNDGSQSYSPSEMGFYDCYLTLNRDGSFVLNISETTFTGIYEVYNNNITLNMSNTSIFDHLDGTITGSTIKIKEAYDIGGLYFDFVFIK